MKMSGLNKSFKLKTKLVPLFFILATCNLQLATFSFADDFHYNNILIGERAAGMGGAYTAISDDPSGCYYNPAGIVFATGRSLSVSVNSYNNSFKTYKGALHGRNGESYDWEQRSARLLPNFFGIVQPLGSGKVGFSYAVPDSTLRDQQQTFRNIESKLAPKYIDRYVININDIDNTYNFGPSYAVKLSDNLSIGATLYAHYRDSDVIRNQFIELKDPITGTTETEWRNYYVSSTEWGYKPILGLMWSPVDKLSIGLTASQAKIISAENNSQTTLRGISSTPYNLAPYGVWDFSDPDPVFYLPGKDNEKREFPLTTTLGMAYFASPSLLVTGDVTFYEQIGEEEAFKIGSKTVGTVNAALGMEYYPSESLAVRAGLFTDMANTPDLSPSKVNQPEHVDIYGGSLSLTRFTRSSSLTIGGSYATSASRLSCSWERSGPRCGLLGGAGQAQVIGGSTAIQDVEIQNMTAFISAGYSY